MTFLQGVLQNNKKLLKFTVVPNAPTPNYAELSIHKMYDRISGDSELLQYLPDRKEKKFPNKGFFWAILYAVRLDFVNKILKECYDHRLACQQEKPRDDLIVSTEWVDQLLKFPVMASKPFPI